MSTKIRANKDYSSRINRVLDYIENNLSSRFNLAQLAEIANFSPFHFHRIFRIYTGETINQFITRVRLEKAATSLVLNSAKSITEIALECGFSSSATFARSFREYYNISATDYRTDNLRCDSKIRKTVGKEGKQVDNIGKDITMNTNYFGGVHNNLSWRMEMKGSTKLSADVTIKDFKPFTVAYVRHIGPYAANEKLFESLFGKLFTWAGTRGLINQEAKVLTIYHDNPDITDEEKLRLSVCIEVPADTEVSGEIGKMELAGGKYASGHFELTANDYGDAWEMMYSKWLPESGYEPDDRPCFELMLNDPQQHPEGKHIVDICISVKPAL